MPHIDRMILRRTGLDALSTSAAIERIHAVPEVRVLSETPPPTLLVEGDARTIARVVADWDGWRAYPVTRYEVPGTRPRLAPAGSRSG